MNKRNGKIEFLRIIFCLMVIFTHITTRLDLKPLGHLTLFLHGNFGVEFFFLISGYLMAASAFKDTETSCSKATGKFIYKKLLGFFPHYLIVFTYSILIEFVLRPTPIYEEIKRLIDYLPHLLMIGTTGIQMERILTFYVEWYLSAMIIGMMILYPCLIKFKHSFSRIICPLTSILLIGYMCHIVGTMSNAETWLLGDLIHIKLVRGIAEMAMGIFTYELASKIRTLKFSRSDKTFLTFIEILCILFPIGYAASDLNTAYAAHAFYLLAIGVTLIFSNCTYFHRIFQNRTVYFLGRHSLAMYLCHPLFLYLFCGYFPGIPTTYSIIGVLTGTLITSVIVQYLGDKLSICIQNKIRQLTA